MGRQAPDAQSARRVAALPLALLLAIFSGRIAGVARRFLLGQKLHHFLGFLALLALGLEFGFFRLADAGFLGRLGLGGGAFGGEALFLFLLLLALRLGGGGGGALPGGGFQPLARFLAPGLRLLQHGGARLLGVFQPVGEFGVVALRHYFLLFQVSRIRKLGAPLEAFRGRLASSTNTTRGVKLFASASSIRA